MASTPPVWKKMERMNKRQLDRIEAKHRDYFTTFSNHKQSKVNEIQSLEKKYDRLTKIALREAAKSVPTALGTLMEMRRVKADILIHRSILTVLRANQFYHRLMVVLAQDTKAGVAYDPEKVKNLIPGEFSDMVDESILSTNLHGVLADLRRDLELMRSNEEAR